MGGQTPHSVKIKVIREWIQGISRDKIASCNQIATGNVTNIIQQTKDNFPDIYLMREIALQLKKENLDINNLASSVRLKKVLDGLDLTEENVDSLLEEMNIHCFKKELNKKEFLSKIEEVSNISNNIGISISDIPSYINQKVRQIAELEREIERSQIQITQQIEEYDITVKDLEEYRRSRPLVDKINELESKLFDKEIEIDSLKEDLFDYKAEILSLKSPKYVLESEFTDTNKWLPENNPLDISELSRITDEIYYNPSRHVDIIKLIRDRHPSKPK
ncbi:MAG: hypothetical protein M3Z01_03130 [Thermoproteota archaeon]|nr:hypothetical protein [Thermoproteota archaeon]